MSTRQIVNLIKNLVVNKLAITESIVGGAVNCRKFRYTGDIQKNEVDGFEDQCNYGPSSYRSGMRKYAPKGYEPDQLTTAGTYGKNNQQEYGSKYGNH